MNSWVFELTDPRLQKILITGYCDRVRAVARKVFLRDEKEWVIVEQLNEAENESRRKYSFKMWFETFRAYSLTVTIMPAILIALFIFITTGTIHVGVGFSALMGALLLQLAINVFNDVMDYQKLIDLDVSQGSGVIQKGWWTPLELKRLGFSCLFLAILFGVPTLLKDVRLVAVIGGFAVFGVLNYSGQHFGFKYKGLGEFLVFLMCGPLLTLGFSVAFSIGQTQNLLSILCIGSFSGWLAVSLLHVNHLQDAPLDNERGVKTIALWLGFSNSKKLAFLYQNLATLSLIILAFLHSDQGALTIGILLVAGLHLFFSMSWFKSFSKASGPHSPLLSGIRQKTAELHLKSCSILMLVFLVLKFI